MDEYHLIYLDADELASIRNRIREGDQELSASCNELLAHADGLLVKPITSVLDKTCLPPSGDKHDFYSIGAYSWPNPNTADGLPYVYKDSQSNPEAYLSNKYDKGRYEAMVEDVKSLSLAYFYSGDERYAEACTALLRSWFIDPATRMNPNLRHAAVRPGVFDGHFSGTIEGVILIEMLDYVALLSGSNSLSAADRSALKQWFLQFSDWLANSRFGRTEIHSCNNHGSYYLAQVMVFAAYGEHHRRAQSAIPFAKKQIRLQFLADGRMPHEMNRPNAFFYSIYGLRAFAVLARAAERYGEDLWHYRIPGQSSPAIANSFYFLSAYLSGRKEWSGPRLDSGFNPYAIQICRMAARRYRAKLLDEMIRFLVAQPSATTACDPLIGMPSAAVSHEGSALFESLPEAQPGQARESAFDRYSVKLVKALSLLGVWPRGRLY